MERLTTDRRETNLHTLLNYAYAKDHAVHLAFGNDEDDIPLDEYIAHEARERGCPRTTTEVMEGGCMECDCPIAILNTVSIQAAELRARLMMIEDILGDTYDLDHLRELIEAERESRGWITVTEQLPTTDGRFMVTIKGRSGKPHVEVRNFLANGQKWESQLGWGEQNVIAWKARPRPYGYKHKEE